MVDRPWSLVFLAGFVVYVGIRHVFAKRTLSEETVERRLDGLEKALLALVALGSLLLPLLYVFTPVLDFADYALPVYAPWAGAVVMVAALLLFWRSHADLGLNWSVSLAIRAGHELIQGGVYRRVRHPMYTAIFLWSIAQGLLLGNWLAGCSALLTFIPLYLLRTPREEAMMHEAFGEAYGEYMNKTGRLLPRMGPGGPS